MQAVLLEQPSIAGLLQLLVRVGGRGARGSVVQAVETKLGQQVVSSSVRGPGACKVAKGACSACFGECHDEQTCACELPLAATTSAATVRPMSCHPGNCRSET